MVKANETEILASSAVFESSGTGKPIQIGKFRLISLLGEGAMGKVIRAEDTKLKRQVALKCLKRKTKETTYRDEQFIREARSAATLDHPGIVRIYEIGEVGQQAYIAMELIEGGSLGSLFKACGRLDLQRACQVSAEAAEALAYAHQHGIVHRDIKLDNLMLTRSGRCKVTDFGLARLDDPEDGFAMPHGAVGTPAYMAPEVISGSPATPKSDVYSLAVVVYVLLSGKTPFQSRDKQKLLRMHLDNAAPDIRTLVPELPESIAKTLSRALAKNPDDRPSAENFARQLRAHTIPVAASQSLTASGSFQPLPTVAAKPSRWLMFGPLIGGTVVALAVVIAMSIVLMKHSETPAPTPATAAPLAESQTRTISPEAPVPPAPVPAPVAASTPVRPATQQPIPLAPSSTINVTDAAQLLAAATAGRMITVTGTINNVNVDVAHNRAFLTFAGAPDAQVLFGQNLSGALSKQFGGHYGSGLIGKVVRVTGTASLLDGKPTLSIAHGKDVELTQ